MTVERDQETQLVGKEGEFEEFGHLFLLCWMQVMMLSGTMFHLVVCFRHRHHSYYTQHDLIRGVMNQHDF